MNQKLFDKVQERYRKLTCLLIKQNITVSTMESCTSGLIASLITDTEGASCVFPGAAVTYSNEQKVENGIDRKLFSEYSVYSVQMAEAMAIAASEKFHTDIGIGVTGCFGNTDPANPEGVPGIVYYAVSFRNMIRSGTLNVSQDVSRPNGKLAAAEKVGTVLLALVEEVSD